jgi:hypothetical protein
MFFKKHLTKMAVVGVLCMVFLAQPAQAYAYGGGGWGVRGGWGWGWPVVGALALGALVTSLWVDDNRYYYDDAHYYGSAQREYVAANPPVDNVITVNIPNNKGGYSAVTLTRSGNGFIGPQGEYYPGFPKVSQLKLMYGN